MSRPPLSFWQLFWLAWLLCLVSSRLSADWPIDDDIHAHRLYAEARYSEAAEIFTDPAWKGLALYRSEQWWRAAEAFVRADDALSAHNLGNSYVQLGYYALALQAYQRALSLKPDLEASQHNAELMRSLLAQDDSEEQRSGTQSRDNEIDRLEQEDESESPRDGGGEGQDSDEESSAAEEPDSARDTTPSAQGNDQQALEDNEQTDDTDSNTTDVADRVAGAAQEPGDTASGTGTSEANTQRESGDIIGRRTDIESQQATEQWLNQISHDPAAFLQKRIALELRRRQAAGQSAPAGGSAW